MSSSEDSCCRFGQSTIRDAAVTSDSPIYPAPDPPLPGEQSVVLDQADHDQSDQDQPDKDQTLEACTLFEDPLAGHCPDSSLEFTSGQDQDQTLEAYIFVKDLLAGHRPDSPLEFTIPKTSFYRLINDPKFESAREE